MIKTTKKLRSVTAAIAIIGSLVTGTDAATTIDFNDGTSGNDVGAFYTTLGLTFLNGEWTNLASGFTPHPQSTGLRLIGDGANFQPKVGTPIVFTFASPMASVSLIANNVNANGARLELYDSMVGGSLVDSDQVVGPSGSTNSNFVLSGSGTGILRAVVYQPFSVESEGVLFDNLTFAPVPEPSAILLIGLGAMGITIRRTRIS